MSDKHLSIADFQDKTIDAHSHVGVAVGMYCRQEYPYAQTIEGLYYQQLSGGIDINVVFPFSGDLYFDPERFTDGKLVPSKKPLSSSPYKIENEIIMRSVFDYRPELANRFIPFVSADPGRAVKEQIKELEELEKKYPIYGIKINPVGCQSHAIKLLDKGQSFLDFARQRNLPFLFHATTVANDEYSQASDIFKIIESYPDIRFCLAHCLIFDKYFLDLASKTQNVWVDTAAIKIQVDLANDMVQQNIINRSDLIDADFSDYRKVFSAICQMYPDMMIWGTDSPAYTYHCRRKQVEGSYEKFAYSGTYENELDAVDSLSPKLRKKVSNLNTIDFIFGISNIP